MEKQFNYLVYKIPNGDDSFTQAFVTCEPIELFKKRFKNDMAYYGPSKLVGLTEITEEAYETHKLNSFKVYGVSNTNLGDVDITIPVNFKRNYINKLNREDITLHLEAPFAGETGLNLFLVGTTLEKS